MSCDILLPRTCWTSKSVSVFKLTFKLSPSSLGLSVMFIRWHFVQIRISCAFSFFISQSEPFYLLSVAVEGYYDTRSHSMTHNRQDSSGRGLGPSQRPLPAQHTTFTTDKYPCPRRKSNPQSQQASGHRPTPYTARPLESASCTGLFEMIVGVLTTCCTLHLRQEYMCFSI